MLNAESAISAYIKIRDAKDKLKERHKEELRKYNDVLAKLDMFLLKLLQEQDAQNIRTKAGVTFKKTRRSVTVSDWSEIFAFIQEHNAWHLLDHRVSKTAVEEFIEQENCTPPGVKIVSETIVGVQRK